MRELRLGLRRQLYMISLPIRLDSVNASTRKLTVQSDSAILWLISVSNQGSCVGFSLYFISQRRSSTIVSSRRALRLAVPDDAGGIINGCIVPLSCMVASAGSCFLRWCAPRMC